MWNIFLKKGTELFIFSTCCSFAVQNRLSQLSQSVASILKIIDRRLTARKNTSLQYPVYFNKVWCLAKTRLPLYITINQQEHLSYKVSRQDSVVQYDLQAKTWFSNSKHEVRVTFTELLISSSCSSFLSTVIILVHRHRLSHITFTVA